MEKVNGEIEDGQFDGSDVEITDRLELKQLRKILKEKEKNEVEEKVYERKYKLLLQDWRDFGKKYSELQKVVSNNFLKRFNINERLSKERDKSIKLTIDCINVLGEKISILRDRVKILELKSKGE